MQFMTKVRVTTAAVGVTFSLIAIAACGAHPHGTGSISPSGTAHGTFRYCSYTPDGDGIEISHHEAVPCVVGDVRSKKDRKKKATPPVGVTVRPSTRPTPRPTLTTSSPTKAPTTTPTTAPPATRSATINLAKKPAKKPTSKKTFKR